MKTELAPGPYQKPLNKTPNLPLEGIQKDGLKKGLEAKSEPISPDYKVELSSVNRVTIPSVPDLPKVEIKETPKVEDVKKVEVKEGSLKKPAIIFIKGLDVFSSPSNSEGGYAGVGRMAEAVEGSRIYGWDQKDEILKEIKKVRADQKVILVGHSLGGDTAVEISNTLDSLAEKFRPVDLLITIDSVGFNNDIIPQNVKKHLNIFGENDSFLNDGPHVARRHEKTNVKNILSADDHTELDDDKELQYEIMNLIQETLSQ
ncbi:MAG: alpha/beta hydrolase [Bacteriovoracaceae bacterium]